MKTVIIKTLLKFISLILIGHFITSGNVLSKTANPIAVAQIEGTTEIDNGLVKASFAVENEIVSQRYFARRGSQWVLVAESFRPPIPYPGKGNELFDSSIDRAHRLIVTEGLKSVKIQERKDNQVIVKLTGAFRNASVQQLVSLKRNENFFHIEVSAELSGSPAKLEYLLSTFTFNLEQTPSFIYTPVLKDRVDDILGDRSFYAPAVILQEGGLFAALAPDLDMINKYQILSPDARRARHPDQAGGEEKFGVGIVDEFMTMPTALDLNVKSGLTSKPLFSFGMIDYVPRHHVRWRHPNDGSMVRTLDKSDLRYGFDLFLSATEPDHIGYQQISRYLWQRYGKKELADPRPQAMPFEEYAKKIYEVTFKPMGKFHPPLSSYKDTGSFLEFELDGQPVGGYRVSAPMWIDLLDNMAWWNNMSDAVGFYYWGTKLKDPSLIDKARRTLNLVLLAPQNNGLFPLIYRVSDKKWIGNHFDPPLEQPDFKNQFIDEGGYISGPYSRVSVNRFLVKKGWDSKSYNIASCSRTGAEMLEYYKQCEKDPRIIPYLKNYADFMLTQIDNKGTVPAWITYDLKPHWILRNSAHNGATMWLLAELYSVTKEKKYLNGAEKIAAFMMKEILPSQAWRDQEHYFSCGMKPIWYKTDQWQGLPTRGVLSQIWGMKGFAALYEASGKEKHIRAGEQVVDFFAFSQTCWNPHYIYTAYSFGGCDTDNGDAAWLNGHQTQTTQPLIWYGLQLGRQDLLERGVAAAHASLALIKNKRHQTNNIYKYYSKFPYTTLIANWTAGENIEHGAWPCDGNRASPGLGEGSAINTGVGRAYRKLGGAYVNIRKNLAIGVNGIMIDNVKLDGRTITIKAKGSMSELTQPWEQPYTTDLRVVELPNKGDFDLIINDSESVKVSAKDLASLPIVVNPDGSIVVDKH